MTIADPTVRAMSADHQSTFRRMEAIEGRLRSTIATMKEARHEVRLDSSDTTCFEAAGAASASAPAAPPPFNAIVAGAVETLRTLRTWP
jgi:hypothetical protein